MRHELSVRRTQLLTFNVMDDEEGNTSGRKDRLRGQIGVSTMALRDGCTIGPPAESEYAVEPVGVDTMRPSDWNIGGHEPLLVCVVDLCFTYHSLCKMLTVHEHIDSVQMRA